MKRFLNMKVGSKLVIAFLVVAAISAIIGAIGLRNMTTMKALADEMYQKELLGVLHAQNANLDLIYVGRAETNIILADSQEQRAKYLEDYEKNLKQLDGEIKSISALIFSDQGRLQIGRIGDADQDWRTLSRQVVDTAMKEPLNAAKDAAHLSMGDARVKLDVMDYLIKELVALDRDNAKAAADRTASIERQSFIVMIGFIFGGVLLSVVLGLVISRMISAPLKEGVEFSQAIAAGDLRQKIDVDRKDEIGMLARSLNLMSVKLQEIVGSVQGSAEQVASSSSQISASAQRLTEGAQNQASTLEETSASVEELTASVDQVAEHARSQSSAVEQGAALMTQVQKAIEEVSGNLAKIAALAGQSVDKATDGARAVEQVVSGINRIAASSEKIGGIVEVISDIADQTNMLALNASIEAARAGEHGRGFAVVAEEVGKLADRSASSTKEIVGLIKESVKSVAEGVKTAQQSQSAMEEIREGARKTKEMTADLVDSMKQQVTAIHQLSDALNDIRGMSSSISTATDEQTANAKQVSKAVENVNELTQSAASAAEEMSAATKQLSTMAQELQRMMERFKVGDEPVPPQSTVHADNSLPSKPQDVIEGAEVSPALDQQPLARP
jgi:methyl-accepting chemotaxis protein